MSSFLETMKSKAQESLRTVVLPEGDDPRTREAVVQIAQEGLANLVVLSEDASYIDEVATSFSEAKVCVRALNHKEASNRETYAKALEELRKHKGLTYDAALTLLDDALYYAVMMVKLGDAHGMVAGACHSTGDTLRPALQILKTAPGAKLVSSFFVMDVPNCEFGDQGTFIFGDCGLNEFPDAEGLANIAVSSAASWRVLFGTEPKVAMLSYSSKGSAKSEAVDKVAEATRIAHELEPGLALDGELQLDAAIVPKVAASKAPESNVAGSADILIFPDLNAGNIGYKLVQRLAHAEAYGPVLQGIAAPVNDLSRGCSAEDIVGVVAITAVQAQMQG